MNSKKKKKEKIMKIEHEASLISLCFLYCLDPWHVQMLSFRASGNQNELSRSYQVSFTTTTWSRDRLIFQKIERLNLQILLYCIL